MHLGHYTYRRDLLVAAVVSGCWRADMVPIRRPVKKKLIYIIYNRKFLTLILFLLSRFTTSFSFCAIPYLSALDKVCTSKMSYSWKYAVSINIHVIIEEKIRCHFTPIISSLWRFFSKNHNKLTHVYSNVCVSRKLSGFKIKCIL